jgi:hypothetical protein
MLIEFLFGLSGRISGLGSGNFLELLRFLRRIGSRAKSRRSAGGWESDATRDGERPTDLADSQSVSTQVWSWPPK